MALLLRFITFSIIRPPRRTKNDVSIAVPFLSSNCGSSTHWWSYVLRSDVPHRFHPNQSRSPHEISNEQNIEFYRIVQKHQPNHHSSVVVKLPAADQSLSLAILHFLFAQKFPLGKMVYFFRGKQSSLARRRIWSGVVLFFAFCLFLNSFFVPHAALSFAWGSLNDFFFNWGEPLAKHFSWVYPNAICTDSSGNPRPNT